VGVGLLPTAKQRTQGEQRCGEERRAAGAGGRCGTSLGRAAWRIPGRAGAGQVIAG
jgi:hypothetical protein